MDSGGLLVLAVLFARFDDGVAFGGFVTANDFSDTVGDDTTRFGIFHRIDMPRNGGVYFGLFKRAVAVLHSAVHEFQIATVTKRLRADDAAVYQGQSFGIPTEIFAL